MKCEVDIETRVLHVGDTGEGCTVDDIFCELFISLVREKMGPKCDNQMPLYCCMRF